MPKKHAMVDLETLGVGDHATIVQIGAVSFYADGTIISRCIADVAVKDWDGTTTPDTIMWWMGQEESVRSRVFSPDVPRVPMKIALADVDRLMSGCTTIWANSPNFDLRILRQAYERHGMEWEHSPFKERDFRTFKKIAPRLSGSVRPVADADKKHTALYDAEHQALWLCNIYNAMQEKLQ